MINTQYINLNMTPSGVLPILHCSQYDIGRPLGVVVYNGSETVDLSAYTATVEATRTDGTAVTAAVTTEGNIGAFATTATMTNKDDLYPAQLVIVDGDSNRVASLPFMMCVVKAAMDENSEAIEEDAPLYQQYNSALQALIADVRADLYTEVSERTAADTVLQGNIDSEATTRQSHDSLLQAQIDQLVAPTGTAPSAAEIENARIGADGVTYQTLGSAIRTNDDALKTMLETQEIQSNLVSMQWTKGRYSGQGAALGSPIDSNNTFCTLAGISYTDTYKLEIKDGYKASFPSFTDGLLVSGPSEFLTGTVTLEQIRANVSHPGDVYAIQIRNIDETAIPAATIPDFIIKLNPTDISAEIADARIGVDGTEYESLGETIRTIDTTLTTAIKNLEIPTNLVNMSWAKGRYNETGLLIGSPNSSNNTFTTLTALNYADVYALEIADGYMASFPSFTEGVMVSGATEFLTGRISIDQIRGNVPRPGTSFAIQIRYVNSDPIPASTRPDFVIKMDPVVVGPENISAEFEEGLFNKYGKTRWYAIGDSITDGRYSYMDGDTPASGTDHEAYYGMIASKMLHFDDVIEYGYSSMGWINPANGGTLLTDILAMDFDTPDLITICLGVNDTAASITLGNHDSAANDGSVSGSIRNACEVLGTKYPNAQIVLLTPLNAINSSTAATQWRRKYTVGGRHSLEEIAELIMYWGDYYGFPVVDMLRNSPINVRNIESMILDGLHPTKKAHEMVAHYLASVLPRND